MEEGRLTSLPSLPPLRQGAGPSEASRNRTIKEIPPENRTANLREAPPAQVPRDFTLKISTHPPLELSGYEPYSL